MYTVRQKTFFQGSVGNTIAMAEHRNLTMHLNVMKDKPSKCHKKIKFHRPYSSNYREEIKAGTQFIEKK